MTATAALPTTVVFCGPSITADEVRAELARVLQRDPGTALVTLPPVAQGDVIHAVRSHAPHTVVIIDGVFERVPAVWHKEILWAMDNGVHLVGASSMGALRAAELHPFGMVGVGEVFNRFRDGELDDDDEVAVSHTMAEDNFRPLSTAMVDLRHHFAVARETGLITDAEEQNLLGVAKSLPYSQRAMPIVLRETAARGGNGNVLSAAAIEWLDGRARDRTFSRKHLDALECLAFVAAHLTTDPAPFRTDGWFVEPTIFLTSAIHEVDQALLVNASEAQEINSDIALVGEGDAVLRKQALLRILAREVAQLRGIRLEEHDVGGVVENFRRRYGLEELQALETWLHAHQLDWPSVGVALADIALVDRVERAYRNQVDASVAPLARFRTARASTPER